MSPLVEHPPVRADATPRVLALLFLLSFHGVGGRHPLGAPSSWHDDELIYRVNHAVVTGNMDFFDRSNFDYPSLPKYALTALTRLVYAAGGATERVVVAARMLSVLLGASAVALSRG